MDYRKTAQEIYDHIGKKENIISAAHCATRLRLVISDNSKADKEYVENIEGVKGVFFAQGQMQIILGTGVVNKVYDEFIRIAGVSESSKEELKKVAASRANPVQRLIKTLGDIFVPIIPAIVASGFLMGIMEALNFMVNNGFLNIDNKKMSKSLGNFFTVREIGEKYDLQVLRFFMLQAHYRSPLNFSAELMEAAKNSLERIRTAAKNLQFLADHAETEELREAEEKLLTDAKEYVTKFKAAMEDDFNTADAIAAIFELVKYANQNTDSSSSKAYSQALLDELTTLCDVLGILVETKEEMLDSDIEALIEERQQARKDRDFARADEIRDELLEKGIVLEDTREGVKWKRA